MVAYSFGSLPTSKLLKLSVSACSNNYQLTIDPTRFTPRAEALAILSHEEMS